MWYTTRPQILAAAEAVPLGSHPYSESNTATTARFDCSYFVADALGAPEPEQWDTVTLVTGGVIVPTDTPEPGDMWGLCGPGTEGPTGHVAIIVSVPQPGAQYWEIVEQTGPDGTPGPHLNTYLSIPDGYQLYKSAYLTTTSATGVDDMLRIVRTDPGPNRYLTNGLTYRLLVNMDDYNAAVAAGATIADGNDTPIAELGHDLDTIAATTAVLSSLSPADDAAIAAAVANKLGERLTAATS